MFNANKQLTVLVKKTDGTYVRMTLAELESLKNEKLKVKSEKLRDTNAQNKKEDKKANASVQRDTKNWTKADAKSLLEEAAEPFHPALPRVSSDRSSQVDEVTKQLDFTIQPQFSNRLRSAIQLLLKDVRTEEQTKETLLRPIKEGGLGLSAAEADKVVTASNKIRDRRSEIKMQNNNGTTGQRNHGAIERERVGTGKTMINTKEELPDVYHEPPVPATATPFNAFKYDANQRMRATAMRRGHAEAVAYITNVQKESLLKFNTRPLAKPVMNDITAPPLEMGPVDEIKFMNLVEFRRLSSDPAEAGSRLKQKFITLREESYLLYLQAMDAWYASPLHNDCMSGIIEGLKTKKRIEEVLADKQKLQISELKALFRIEEEL